MSSGFFCVLKSPRQHRASCGEGRVAAGYTYTRLKPFVEGVTCDRTEDKRSNAIARVRRDYFWDQHIEVSRHEGRVARWGFGNVTHRRRAY
jgi:hypothetical protein